VSAVRLPGAGQGRQAAQRVVETLVAWGAERGASRAYLRVPDGEVALGRIAESLGFTLHHRGRYLVAARS
jgi:hypothetical protein